MPKVLYANEGTSESVTRPIVFEIARDIQKWTNMGNISILFPGDSELAVQPGSTINNESSFNRLNSQNLLRISVREEYEADKILATAVHQMDEGEIFLDPVLGVYMRPVYARTSMVLEFQYRTTDVHSIRRWRDEFTARLAMNRDIRQHSLSYSYLIPKEYFELLHHIHTLREANAGYGETFDVYLEKHLSARASVNTTLVGTQGRWAVSETQGRIYGIFDFDGAPDPGDKDNESAAWKTAFSYKLEYACPIATSFDFPVLVHQQLVDEKYFPVLPKDSGDEFLSRSSRSMTAIGSFEVDRFARKVIQSGIRLPEFHEFSPLSAPRHTLQVISALVAVKSVAEEPTRKVLNLSDLGADWTLRPEFIEYLKRDHQYLHRYGESLVNITVYVDRMPMHHSRFKVDSDLNVVLNEDPDLRRTYYVRVSLITDPAVLSRPAKERAQESGNGVIIIGVAVQPALAKELPKMLPGNYIPKTEIDKFFQKWTGQYIGSGVTQWNRVMILFIEAYSISDLKRN